MSRRERRSPQEIIDERIERAASERGEFRLDLSHLGLTKLPIELAQLNTLRGLILAGNFLSTLPDWLGELASLNTLVLNNNELERLPESIAALPLRHLDVSGNRLTTLPQRFYEVQSLHTLILSKNEFAALPDAIETFVSLEALLVYSNKLHSLPVWIGKLCALRQLTLGSNRLKDLPQSLSRLSCLRALDLSYNELTHVPESIGSLQALQKLDLGRNAITELPASLAGLTKLEELYLHNNAGLDIPEEILGPTHIDVIRRRGKPAKPADILQYYMRSVGGRALNEAKLILVGRGGVGKTSLVRRLVADEFGPQAKTHGIQITQWPIKVGADDARLHVWDFGGQEVMHATHQFFFTKRTLYLLVLSAREGGEDSDADYWLRLIESFGTDSPVIVVLNKTREQPLDLNRRALKQKYAGVREFIRTDCEDRTGIDELRRAIERETARLEQVHARFPRRWFTIKDRLAGMKQNFLSFDEYRRLCADLGESDHDAQDKLAEYLHLLGIALNYREDPRLQDTHVLNPRWVTVGIYQIINSLILAEQNGVLRLQDLRTILDRHEYPDRMHQFLLDLMRKFDLCFPFGDDASGRYLIPELLDKQEPTLAAEFAPAQCLNFEYRYAVLPEGLIPRFIVRTHAMSEGLPRWRSGAILRFEGNRALVKGDRQERKVSISVSGPTRTRRHLLAVIRADFDRIHADISKLQPKAMVPVAGHPEVLIEYDKLLKLEARGIAQLQEVVGDDVLTLSVRDLLDGVDVVSRSSEESALIETRPPARLFISYSHKDDSLRAELDAHLKLLLRIGLIEKWDDRMLRPGAEWESSIDENLEQADIILLLISADFINSDFCWHEEMDRALQRHAAREATVIPVIVRDVDWTTTKFAKLQALPKDGKPVTLWPYRDSAWKDVAVGIRGVAQEFQHRKRV